MRYTRRARRGVSGSASCAGAALWLFPTGDSDSLGSAPHLRYSGAVKGDPAPDIDVQRMHRNPSAFENFDPMMRKVVAVPKVELDKREAAYQRQRAQKKHSSK
jgi:hypothetical protein